tara:strand:- start:2 stop:586 length:585 start_codon:yes stop_codon:yes gene_type:complete
MDSKLQDLRVRIGSFSGKSTSNLGLIPSAVLVLLYLKNDEVNVLLNKRSETVEHHKNEISFPGGRMDKHDHSLFDTALRETKEEIGVSPDDVNMFGQLDQVETMTGYSITPYVGTIPEKYNFIINSAEVSKLLEIPLFKFNDGTVLRKELRYFNGNWLSKHNYVYEGHLIWGATANIIGNLVKILDISLDDHLS